METQDLAATVTKYDMLGYTLDATKNVCIITIQDREGILLAFLSIDHVAAILDYPILHPKAPQRRKFWRPTADEFVDVHLDSRLMAFFRWLLGHMRLMREVTERQNAEDPRILGVV